MTNLDDHFTHFWMTTHILDDQILDDQDDQNFKEVISRKLTL